MPVKRRGDVMEKGIRKEKLIETTSSRKIWSNLKSGIESIDLITPVPSLRIVLCKTKK